MDKIDKILLAVQKPGRYTGGEWNSVAKEWHPETLKVCLAFPDIYEIGMSHLGLKILYGILNRERDILCERSFCPWPDFEQQLRQNDIPLFSLESRRSLRDFDILGFSLSYELCYTNMLTMLDLASIPLRSAERGERDPIVIAGGPACYNPEPIADFIDAFLIGDAEDAVLEMALIVKNVKIKKNPEARKTILRELSSIKGVYVPSMYGTQYTEGGSIKRFFPIDKEAPYPISKRIVRDLDSAYYPTEQIVPNISVVHDRIALEIMRGCKHRCGFCQACMEYLPARERSAQKIVELAMEAYRSTGLDEISLLSLSSGDYSGIEELIAKLNGNFAGLGVSISVPSLRVEDIVDKLPLLISVVKKSGLTFAPEAASARLRSSIGKNINIEKLFQAAEESYRRGWKRVKLYFMIGLPGETDEDVVKIAELAMSLSDLKRRIDGRPAAIALSVNAFLPKPHSVLENNTMEDMQSLKRKQAILRNAIKSRNIELSIHSIEMSRLECLLGRGDRRVAVLIHEAWKRGAKFDGWKESFNMSIWEEALRAIGMDPEFYITRSVSKDEVLPWDFIETSG